MTQWRNSLWRLRQFAVRFTRRITVGVRALVVDRSDVVLVKHTYTNGWFLPGGTVERGESLVDAIRRELHEELGIQSCRCELFGAYSSFREGRSDHIVVFKVSDFDLGSIQRSEIEAAGRFATDKLPDDVTPATRRRIVEMTNDENPISGRW